MVSILALCGLGYAFFVIIPISLQFLLSINISGIQNMITASSYLDFLLVQSFIIAIIFRFPFSFWLAPTCALSTPMCCHPNAGTFMWVVSLHFAVITPTVDIFNLLIVAVPAANIYEGSLLAARFLQWRMVPNIPHRLKRRAKAGYCINE